MIRDPDSRVQAAAEIRPGVFRPDWSVVTLPAAGRALRRRTVTADVVGLWTGLRPAADKVWRTTVRLFAELGRAPSLKEIAQIAELAPEIILPTLRALRDRDLLVMDDDVLTAAYPFTSRRMTHQVTIEGRQLNALCAIDALGAGAMLESDAFVASACRHCGVSIKLRTEREGTTLGSVEPAKTVVWYAIKFDGCAARSSCPATVFFCGDDCLNSWLAKARSRENGERLSASEAFQAGVALFGPILKLVN